MLVINFANRPARRPIATPGTLSQCAECDHPARQCLGHAQVGQCGCHRLDELLLPNLRIENGELLARHRQQFLTWRGPLLHSCLVLAHQVEQSAHLPRGLLRLPACLQRAQGSTGACVFSGAVDPVTVRRYMAVLEAINVLW